MKIPSRLLLSVLALALAFSCAFRTLSGAVVEKNSDPVEEKRHRVFLVDDDRNECPTADFTQIQPAVNAASSGDVVQVCPGVYNEQVEIAKRLTLVGVERNGKKASVVRPANMIANSVVLSEFFGGGAIPVATAILVRDASDVDIKNIIVDGTNNGIAACEPVLLGIYYRNASGVIDSATVRNIKLGPGLEECPTGLGVYTESSGAGRSRLTITDSSVHDCQLNGMAAMEPGTTFRATYNVVTGLGPASGIPHPGIALGRDAQGSIEDNIVNNYVFAPCVSITECDGNSSGIIVFFTSRDVKVVRNVVGKTQVGIFVIFASNVSVIDNNVFDTDVFDGIAIIGDNTTVKGNLITNSEEAAVFLQGMSNTVRNNTINETPVGLLVTAGNSLSGNQFFNTALLEEVFDPGVSAENFRADRRQKAIAFTVIASASR